MPNYFGEIGIRQWNSNLTSNSDYSESIVTGYKTEDNKARENDVRLAAVEHDVKVFYCQNNFLCDLARKSTNNCRISSINKKKLAVKFPILKAEEIPFVRVNKLTT